MSLLVKPHGAETLKPLLLEGSALLQAQKEAANLPCIELSSREVGDIIMLGIGGFTPLEGFMNKADWQGVCDNYQMANGLFWPIPITLSTTTEKAATLNVGDKLALKDPESGTIMGTLLLSEKY